MRLSRGPVIAFLGDLFRSGRVTNANNGPLVLRTCFVHDFGSLGVKAYARLSFEEGNFTASIVYVYIFFL